MLTPDGGISFGFISTIISTIIAIVAIVRTFSKDRRNENQQNIEELKKQWEQEQKLKDIDDRLKNGNKRFSELDEFIKEMREYTKTNTALVEEIQKSREDLIPLEMLRSKGLEKLLEKYSDDPEIADINKKIQEKYDELMVKKK